MLQSEGHKVVLASGAEGLAARRRQAVDVVLVDGIETILELQGEFPGIKVVSTSDVAPMDCGGLVILCKPLERSAVLEAIDDLLYPR
jgi:hypothetical protein